MSSLERNIKDITKYNPKELPLKVLLDDLRIVTAWYSRLLENKPFVYSKKDIEELAAKILNELIRRDVKLNFYSNTKAFRKLAEKVLPKISTTTKKKNSPIVEKIDGKKVYYAYGNDGLQYVFIPTVQEVSEEAEAVAPSTVRIFIFNNSKYIEYAGKVFEVLDNAFIDTELNEVHNGAVAVEGVLFKVTDDGSLEILDPIGNQYTLTDKDFDEYIVLRLEPNGVNIETSRSTAFVGFDQVEGYDYFIDLKELKDEISVFDVLIKKMGDAASFKFLNSEYLYDNNCLMNLETKELFKKIVLWAEKLLKLKGQYSVEDIFNIHEFVVGELKKRGLEHEKIDSLDAMSLDEDSVTENNTIKIPDSKDVLIIKDFISLVGSSVKKDDFNDIDILIRADESKEFFKSLMESIVLQIRKLFDNKYAIHYITAPQGPHDDYIPLFDLVLRANTNKQIQYIETINALNLKFLPVKTKGGYGEYTFSVSDEGLNACWELWAQGLIANGIPIVIQKKFDGFRVIARKSGNTLKITSEDTPRPLNNFLPKDLLEDLAKIKEDYVLDGELELYAEEDLKGVGLNFDYAKGDKIERIDMKSFLKKNPAGKFSAKYHIFDVVYFGETSYLENQSYDVRLEILDKIFKKFSFKTIFEVKSYIVNKKSDFIKAIKKVASEKYSEGAMAKALTFIYPKNGRSSLIAKLKVYKELVVVVLDKQKTKSKESGD